MKRFACGDVVPNCAQTWERPTEQEILVEVARHAAADHGMTEIPDDLVVAVRSHITTVA